MVRDLAEIKEIFELYDSEAGEKGQMIYLLEKLDARRKKLQVQRKDVEQALLELERIYQKVRKALDEL